jgi:outer membrane protein OmpA-like peptidoglycan-associated protein
MNSLNCVLFSKTVLFLIIGLGVSCSTVPTAENSLLTEASEIYAQASANPNITSEALVEAKSALEQAKQSKDNEAQEHFAYLAKRYAQIAITIAKRQELELARKNLLQPATKPSLTEHHAQNANRQPLQQQLTNWQPNSNEQLILTLEDIWSKTELADLLPEARQNLTEVATFLNQHPELQIMVRSYNNSNYDQYHLGLAERRAYAVKFALINRGIPSTRIIASDSVENRRLISNQTTTKSVQNNGVELIIFKASNWL